LEVDVKDSLGQRVIIISSWNEKFHCEIIAFIGQGESLDKC
jgi:hypothetical protein